MKVTVDSNSPKYVQFLAALVVILSWLSVAAFLILLIVLLMVAALNVVGSVPN